MMTCTNTGTGLLFSTDGALRRLQLVLKEGVIVPGKCK
jgi:hypothetical protein